jgi:6,7-dimethyl-8-ribityllumazine synthase
MSASSANPSLFDTSALQSLREAKVAIVSTEWNEAIVGKLIEGCMRVLGDFGAVVTHNVKVPGAVELVYACNAVATAHRDVPEAIIAFGAVIRGGTPHFEYVCDSVTQGLTTLNAAGNTPVIFGVLTLDNEAQAWERLGGEHGHKGEEAALAALKMIALRRQLMH